MHITAAKFRIIVNMFAAVAVFDPCASVVVVASVAGCGLVGCILPGCREISKRIHVWSREEKIESEHACCVVWAIIRFFGCVSVQVARY